MKNISNQEWKERIAEDPKAVVIDSRTSIEWESGILPNAKHLDMMDEDAFVEKAKKLEKDANYYVYCQSGLRSMRACQIMDDLGVENTYNLMGGIKKWDGNVVLPE